MQPILGKLYSPYLRKITKLMMSGESGLEYANKTVWENQDASVYKIRTSPGQPVKTFRELIESVALVTLNNKSYEMYYRGQTHDHKDYMTKRYKNQVPKTIIYPSICRPEKKEDGSYKMSIRGVQINKRYDDLYNLIKEANKSGWNSDEYYFSLFQHYEILPTPLIDITQSLRVAATFSLKNSDSGYLYVLRLPYPYQSISYFNDLGIILIKLQNVCPTEALRPRYQEGYLVGKFPFRPTKSAGDNLAQRLIAKFYIDNKEGQFWDLDFPPMPPLVLRPPNEEFEERLKQLRDKLTINGTTIK